MTAKIEQLTPEQGAMIPAVRDEFLRIGLSTDTADFDAAEAAIKDAYAVAGLAAPMIFIRLASPHEGAIGAAILKGTKLGKEVRAQVGAQVWDQVRARVWDQVRAQVGDQVRAQVRDRVGAAFYSQHEAGFLSFYSFFANAVGLDSAKRLEARQRLAKSCGWVWFFEGAAIMTDRPMTLRRDEQTRLHCENGPALEYRDGFSVYAWHGTRLPKEWVENRQTIDPAEILKCENVEQRAAGAAMIGWPRMVAKLKRKIIDGDPDGDKGALIELTLPGLREPGRFLQAICPRNGTIVEGVPRVSDIDGMPIETVIAAQAWRIGDPQSEYTHPPVRT